MGVRVLICDDDPLHRALLRYALAGAEVLEVAALRQALRAAA